MWESGGGGPRANEGESDSSDQRGDPADLAPRNLGETSADSLADLLDPAAYPLEESLEEDTPPGSSWKIVPTSMTGPIPLKSLA